MGQSTDCIVKQPNTAAINICLHLCNHAVSCWAKAEAASFTNNWRVCICIWCYFGRSAARFPKGNTRNTLFMKYRNTAWKYKKYKKRGAPSRTLSPGVSVGIGHYGVAVVQPGTISRRRVARFEANCPQRWVSEWAPLGLGYTGSTMKNLNSITWWGGAQTVVSRMSPLGVAQWKIEIASLGGAVPKRWCYDWAPLGLHNEKFKLGPKIQCSPPKNSFAP